MRWKRPFVICCSSLFLLGFAGCKKIVKVNVDPALAPLSAAVSPGNTLEWVPMAPGESFNVVFQSGLCTQGSPLHATYDHPALCTVAKQTFGTKKEPIVYTYYLDGLVEGRPFHSPQYRVAVGPGGCPHC